jgi:hypothetical protein
MGAIISYIESIDRIQKIVYKKIYGECYNCKKNIILNDNNVYCYKILGLGKHDKKIICQECLKNKFMKFLV